MRRKKNNLHENTATVITAFALRLYSAPFIHAGSALPAQFQGDIHPEMGAAKSGRQSHGHVDTRWVSARYQSTADASSVGRSARLRPAPISGGQAHDRGTWQQLNAKR
jgi:hypothetical protein